MGKAKTQAMTGEEKEAAKAMFDKFDDNKNGVLEENEFKCALKAMNRKFGDTNNDPADDVCAAAFKKADQDSSGSVDLQEFEVAYAAFKKFQEDKHGVAAKAGLVELFISAATVIPGVSHAVSGASTVSDSLQVKNKKAAEAQALLATDGADDTNTQAAEQVAEEAANEMKCVFNMMIIGIITVFFLVVAFQLIWPIVFWVGYAQGESCDEPLDTWVLGSAIISTLHAIPY